MERIDLSPLDLQTANSKIQQLLEMLRPAEELCAIDTDHVRELFAEVLRIAGLLGKEPESSLRGPLADELARYREHLDQLRQILPRLHGQLLTRRLRLEAERAHLDGAAAWVHSACADR